VRLCLDVGNTHILGGVFDEEKLIFRFRYATHLIGTADQFGLFLVQILQTHGIAPLQIQVIAVGSVVPSYDFTIRHTVNLYFKAEYFVLQAGARTGLRVKCITPNEVGADRIANAIGAVNAFPNRNILIIDMGTATTLCVINKKRDYLGGLILPGMRLGMESLRNNTAKLMEVDIEAPATYIGRNTRENIQAGLYYGHLGALKEMIAGIKAEAFGEESFVVIGTGGFAQLFREKGLFAVILPDLVLQGLNKAYDYSLLRV
jgi:type III pantothenate kinase